ncbi:jg5227 [Pararge aegeria aegeria]|uniref:Jg5227 protein n=1 Tax=Pararge aegeria aegeria TaxID=348720 RepID=A0A8S4QTM0_9NEOP|nr:jg5227 [Pararge aegeria aegeria]
MWSNERELQFLEYYHMEPILWDSKHVKHKDKQTAAAISTSIVTEIFRTNENASVYKYSLAETITGRNSRREALDKCVQPPSGI